MANRPRPDVVALAISVLAAAVAGACAIRHAESLDRRSTERVTVGAADDADADADARMPVRPEAEEAQKAP